MTTIDLIVLGMLKQEPLSAYDIQKLLDYRHISEWVKISTPSVYKKVKQLENKGYIDSKIEKNGNMPEKTIYSITESGQEIFEKLMIEISEKPIHLFLDFNAVIVNLENITGEKQEQCLLHIRKNIENVKAQIEENLMEKKESTAVSKAGMAVLEQQHLLIQTIEVWLDSLEKSKNPG